MEVLDHGIEIEALEFLRIIELLVHGIGQGGVLVQDLQVQLIRPPARIGRCARNCVPVRAHYRAFGFGWIIGYGRRCSCEFVFHLFKLLRISRTNYKLFATNYDNNYDALREARRGAHFAISRG